MLTNIFLLSGPGPTEWMMILLGVLLLFGGKKIPELMRGVGRGMREFNDAKNSVKSEFEEGMREKDRPAAAPNPPAPTATPATPADTPL